VWGGAVGSEDAAQDGFDAGKVLADFYAAAPGRKMTQSFPDETGTPTAFLVTGGATTYVFYTAKSFKAPTGRTTSFPSTSTCPSTTSRQPRNTY
jgi:hypothetical protein